MFNEKKKFRFNPRSKDFLHNPYPTYEQMQLHYPAYRVANTLILTRYEDVFLALRNRQLATTGIPLSLKNEFNKHLILLDENNAQIITDILLFQDGVTHQNHRKSMMKLLSGENLQQIEVIIKSEICKLINRVRGSHSIDIIAETAHPLWFKVFSSWLKLDTNETEILYQQSKNIRYLLDPSAITSEGLHQLIEALNSLSTLFHHNFAVNKASETRSLFFTAVTAEQEEYSMMDYTIDAITAFIGGGETTGALIGSAVYYLSKLPDIQAELRHEPMLIRNFIQEVMRLESPLQMTRRRVIAPMTINGVELKPDDNVLLCLGAANRDKSLFCDPALLSLERKNGGKQLGFGAGMHQCLGQQLAQKQAELLCLALLEGFPVMHYAGEPSPCWQESSLILRALSSLPVRLQ